jgi:CHAT domain-containing protein
MSILRLPLVLIILGLLLATTTSHAAPDDASIARGVALRNGGSLQQAIDYFSVLRASGDAAESVAAIGELGATLLQARRYEEAEPHLRAAYGKTEGNERARYAIELGNLAATRRRPQEAQVFFREARMLADGDSVYVLMARINEARLAERQERPALLAAISRDLSGIGKPLQRARMRLSMGALAVEVGSLQVAYENLEEARTLAAQADDVRIEIEALDGLAQIYEEQGRKAEALQLSHSGITRAQAADGMVTDILLRLEWRQGRLLAAQGADQEARAAYQRAIEHIESIRQDIPIEYESGRSSFRDTLEPIYLGYIDLLLKKAGMAEGGERATLLRRTRDIAELIKQSELMDYLGERCSVDSVRNIAQGRVEPGTAIFYPIILKDRVEVIFESEVGITLHTTLIDAQSLRNLVLSYAGILRGGEDGYLTGASQLYDILVRPFERELETQRVHTLLVVPDSVLRMLPWATLYNGKQFLLEKYSIVINSGLSMTSQVADQRNRAKGFSALLAGMAQPGPVVDKLARNSLVQFVKPSIFRSGIAAQLERSRSLRSVTLLSLPEVFDSADRGAQLKKSLALPGVKTEIDALSKIMPGTSLLDATFTTGRLHDEFDENAYRTVHIATHGFFGSTGGQSYILAYDDLVTMEGLQKLLQLKVVKKNPIELLTLSACETAEGDDRSPLGIAGAAIKANAKSVLGTLWPVSDEAAQQIMTKFYTSLVRDGVSKAEALRLAQVALIKNPDFVHPFFWAPFILIGSWH